MTVDLPRETALKVLYDIHQNSAYSNISLDKRLESSALKPVDRSFVTELVYGTEKWLLKIDWIISAFSEIKMKKISPWILNIIRLGVFQILYMDKVPVSAACNESVKLARKYGHKGSAGFVNAILREIAERKDSIEYPDKSDIANYLSIYCSHPRWLAEKFLELFGEEFTESLLMANNDTPLLTVRANTLKISREELIKELAGENIAASPGRYCDDALILHNPSSISKIEAFKNGYFQVQDESSMLAVRVLDPKPGEFILDVCSAPGGKATYAAQLMKNEGKVLARDIHPHKLELLKSAAERLGTDIIQTEIHDASVHDGSLTGKADRVIVDAPCTGLGIIRRKPDIKWSKKQSDLDVITGLQFRILAVSSGYVRKGGVLVYCTCTVLPEENDLMVERFLNSEYGAGFVLEDISLYLPEELLPGHGQAGWHNRAKPGMIQLYPNVSGTDGFFIARMRRANG